MRQWTESLLRFRERDDLTDVLLVPHQHHDSVESGCDAGMRRRTVRQHVYEITEPVFDIFWCDAEDVEELLTKMLIDEDLQVRKNTAMALMKLGAINTIEALKEAKSIESNESVEAVFGVAINILSRDAQEESE